MPPQPNIQHLYRCILTSKHSESKKQTKMRLSKLVQQVLRQSRSEFVPHVRRRDDSLRHTSAPQRLPVHLVSSTINADSC